MNPEEVTIDSLAAGGDGVGRLTDGRVVFVPFTVPGDRVRIEIVEARPRFLRGRVDALLEASPQRVEPVCAVFGTCGGCSWQHVDYPAQVEAKRKILHDTLTRVGKLSLPPEIEMLPSPAPYGYRSRARVLVDPLHVGYRERRSHELCPTTQCPILVTDLERKFSELAAKPPTPAGEWELAQGDGETRATPLTKEFESGASLTLRVGADEIDISPGVFAQANQLLLEPLAREVHAAAGSGEIAFEFYAGAGFLTLGLARQFETLHAVEASRRAVRDLRHNLERAGIENVRIAGVRAEFALASRRMRKRPDVIILDPPRTGLAKGLAESLAQSGAKRVVYLSCDPATLARDLAFFAAARYRATRVQGFDLFPQTHHLEALVVMDRDD